MIESITLKNLVTNQSILIDKTTSDWVLGEIDLGTVEGSHHSYKYVNQVGVYIDSTSLEERAVSIPGWVIGENFDDMKDNMTILNRLVNPQHELELTLFDQYVLRFKPDYSIKYATPYEENNEVLCQFLIQGTCADPMFSTKSGILTQIASILPKFHFPLIIPQGKGIILGLRQPDLLATIVNDGDIDTGMVIEFSCNTTVVNPSLLHVGTQEFVKINKTITPGETITVSTVSGNKYVRGYHDGQTENYFKYWDWDSTWLQMYRGVNVLKYDADEGVDGLSASVTFTPKLLEVQ